MRMLKLSKEKNENALTLYQYQRIKKKKKSQYYQMQGHNKIQMFKLQPKLARRQLKVKNEDIIRIFTNEKAEQYVHTSFIRMM